MFACAKRDCSAPAEWEPTLVIVSPTEEIRVGVPVPVCTAHRRGLRQVLLEGGIPAVETLLAQRRVTLRTAALRLEFTALN